MVDKKADVFISHSAADRVLAEALTVAIERALPAGKRVVFTSSQAHGYATGAAWLERIPRDVAECCAHIAVVTIRGLESAYFLMELGARWGAGKNILPAAVPNVSLDQLPELLRTRQVCSLADYVSLAKLISDVQESCGGAALALPREYEYAEQARTVNALAEKYEHSTPTPLMFDRTENTQRLSADQIVAGAEAFIDGRMPTRDGFDPHVAVGINSGGTFAASIFSERHPNIRMGTIWTRRDGGLRVVDPASTFLPVAVAEKPRVLLVDSKLGSGHSLTVVRKFVSERYGPDADIRLLVTLVYEGWGTKRSATGRADIGFPDKPFWPASLTLSDGTALKIYATYYTNRHKDRDDIAEPGRSVIRAQRD